MPEQSRRLEITKNTLLPISIIGVVVASIVSIVIYVTSVHAATRENNIKIETNCDRLDRYEMRFDRVDVKLDKIFEKVNK